MLKVNHKKSLLHMRMSKEREKNELQNMTNEEITQIEYELKKVRTQLSQSLEKWTERESRTEDIQKIDKL